MGLRITEREAALLLGEKLPPHPKYHNKPERLDGVQFDSQLELKRYCYLVHVEMAGLLTDLMVHPRFDLLAATPDQPVKCGEYEGDFSYIDEMGMWVVEDTKGVVLPLYALKRKLFRANYPDIKLVEVRLCKKQWSSQVVA